MADQNPKDPQAPAGGGTAGEKATLSDDPKLKEALARFTSILEKALPPPVPDDAGDPDKSKP